MAAYLTYLLDLEKTDQRIVEGSLKFTPDPSRAPTNAFRWKVTCDARGQVAVRARDNGKLRVIATAMWSGTLTERKQKGTTPTDFQWDLVQTTLEEASALRKADPSPYDDSLVEDVRAGDLGDPPPSLPSQIYSEAAAGGRERKRADPPYTLFAMIAAAVIVAVIVVIGIVKRKPARKATPAPVAVTKEAPPPMPEPPPTPEPPVEPVDPRAAYMPGAAVDVQHIGEPESIEARVANAENLDAAFALARPTLEPAAKGAMAALQLTRYKLRWSDVAGAAQTTVAKVEKDADEERGKHLCAEGVIDVIERSEVPGQRIFAGVLTTGEGDRVAFVVTGSTGELVKRTRGTVCGIVTGKSDGATTVYGMFDLPENRHPTVEKPD